jgi:hypothetical protein
MSIYLFSKKTNECVARVLFPKQLDYPNIPKVFGVKLNDKATTEEEIIMDFEILEPLYLKKFKATKKKELAEIGKKFEIVEFHLNYVYPREVQDKEEGNMLWERMVEYYRKKHHEWKETKRTSNKDEIKGKTVQKVTRSKKKQQEEKEEEEEEQEQKKEVEVDPVKSWKALRTKYKVKEVYVLNGIPKRRFLVYTCDNTSCHFPTKDDALKFIVESTNYTSGLCIWSNP